QRTRKWAMLAVAFALAIVAAGAGLLLRRTRSHALTEKDTLVLSDFVNETGDDVFNDALKQGLAVDLQQSPFLNILSDRKIGQQLRLMGRSPEERLTPAVAREVCRREGSRVTLQGSIAGIGSHYVITLKAVDCQNGNALDTEQGEADRREQVL